MKLSDGEKIIIKLLADIHEKLGIEKDSQSDFIMESIYSGNLWSIKEELDWLLNGKDISEEIKDETFDILDMWRVIETSFNNLSDKEQSSILEATNSTNPPEFKGFDANNETHYWVAKHIIKQMKRYTEFENRELNSHCMVIDMYRRMLEEFNKTPRGHLTPENIIQILEARKYPEGNS